MNLPTLRYGKLISIIVLGVIVAGAVTYYVLNAGRRQEEVDKVADHESSPPAELVRGKDGEPIAPATLRLSERTARAMGLGPESIVKAAQPKQRRPLPPQMGTLAYDNDRLFAVRSRFAGEVSEILDCPTDQLGSIPIKPPQPLPKSIDILGARDTPRAFSVGDRVKKDQLLAIVWSRDLADKKAALIDATIDLRRDSARLKDLEKLYFEGSVSAASYYEAQRTVKKDISARNAAERILRVWKLDDKEIDGVLKEADTIEEEKRDPKKEKDWARVEVRAPHEGVIVEKNTHVGDWADPANYATPMFRVADLSKLQVWITPAEEYLPVLQDFLKKPSASALAWDIFLQAEPQAPPLTGALLRIAPSLDFTQHTPLLVGVVDNPGANLLIGQFVTAVIYVPLEHDLVEIPTTAVNEEKGQSVVFVQPDSAKREFSIRAVDVVYRFKDVVYVRAKTPKVPNESSPDTLPVTALKAGDLVICESVIELTKALRDLLAKEKMAQPTKEN